MDPFQLADEASIKSLTALVSGSENAAEPANVSEHGCRDAP